MSFKIALNAGHGHYTPGKRCSKSLDPNETREWDLNSRICNKIEEKLKAYDGYSLIRLDDTTGKVNVALKTRTDKANKFGADIYLAIHHNAGINGGKGGGIMAFTYTSVGTETKDWQKRFYDAAVKYSGLKGNRSNPLAKADLHECRESKMPAVLMECGFMDSATDVPIILTDKFADDVATGLVEVLVEKGGLIKKETHVEPQPTPEAPAQTAKSVEDVAREVLAGKWGNGVDRKNRLIAAGYDYSAVQAKVNEIASGKTSTSAPKKSVEEIAREVIQGKWGNGADRKKRIIAAGYDYAAVQKKVNELL